MRISLEAIESFAILCRVKSYSKTAKVMGCSQPAISNRVRSLESLVGCKLVESGSFGFRLTPGGRELLNHSEEILRSIHHIRSISDKDSPEQVRISLISTVESFLNPYNIFNTGPETDLPALFVDMKSFEDIEAQARNLSGNRILYTITQDKSGPLIEKSWPFTMRWIASKDFILNKPMKQLTLPIVELSDQHRLANAFYAKLEFLGFECKPVFRADGINSYLNAIASGVGLGCIGDLFVIHKMTSKNLVFLDEYLGNLGTYFLNRINPIDLSDQAARAAGIFDKAIDNQVLNLRNLAQ